jgi:catechol 2,3-dioxygenase-like lactoylglutathione lyase family enzyme
MVKIITKKSTKAPLLKINFLSHGTLESRDLQASRRFYEEVLGLEVIQHLPHALTIRHGSNHTYVVVHSNKPKEMNILNHNGLDVGTEEEVRAAYEILRSVQQEYGIRKISKPGKLHGYYAFMFQDMDANWWEILVNSPGGYSGLFDKPENDLTNRSVGGA